MEEFVRVTKEEFENFIKNYPSKLEEHWIFFCTPAIITWNDFSAGRKYPETIVAKTYDYSDPVEYGTKESDKEYLIKIKMKE